MDHSIQQLTLIRQSIHSSVDYKAGGTQEQLVIIKVLNSEHLISKRIAIAHGTRCVAGRHRTHVVCHRQWGCCCDGYSHKTFYNDPSDLHSSIQLLSGCVDQRGSASWDGRAQMIQGGMP